MDSLDPSSVFQLCDSNDYCVDVFRDRTDRSGISVTVAGQHYFVFDLDHAALLGFMSKLGSCKGREVMFDFHRLEDVGITPIMGARLFYDVKLLFRGERSLYRLAQIHLSPEDTTQLQEVEQNMAAHYRVCKTSRVDLHKHSILKLIPLKLFRKTLKIRGLITLKLWELKLRTASEEIEDYEKRLFPLATALYEAERNGIKVDTEYVQKQLSAEHPPAISKFFRSMKELDEDGYLYTVFDPVGGKTGRFKVESGFNCMGIPHGPCRKAIVSRFGDGKVYAFDYNAIDYRCIVASLQDKQFTDLYDRVEDFHSKTTSFLFGTNVDSLKRDVVKKLTYISVYGGSVETIADKTGLSPERAQVALDRLNEKLQPIHEFRQRLFTESQKNGFVLLPNGRKIKITSEDHPGKVIGLYAQGFSSYVFEEAFKSVVRSMRNFRRSKLLFTVHDELVVDMHPSEFSRDVEIKNEMEQAVQGYGDMFKVKISCGRDYGEATD